MHFGFHLITTTRLIDLTVSLAFPVPLFLALHQSLGVSFEPVSWISLLLDITYFTKFILEISTMLVARSIEKVISSI